MQRILNKDFAQRLAALYREMEAAYDLVAQSLAFGCTGCPDNCCDSYFLHYTYLEWAYLWEGLGSLDEKKKEQVISGAAAYVVAVERALTLGQRPLVLCPLNEEGRCILYAHRLMICRMHGVPSSMVRPDGKRLTFPGCFRCQEVVAAYEEEVPEVDRTDFYRRLVAMEHELLGPRRHFLPRTKMTIAQMIVKGPPEI